MKTLYLARHAKAASESDNGSDHDRPLTKRGCRDAVAMGRLLAARGPRPDAIISSTALRALATAMRHAAAFGIDDGAVRTDSTLYLVGEKSLRGCIAALDAGFDCVMLVGHNPGFSVLASMLAGRHVSLPTCGIATIVCDGLSWADVASGTGTRLLHFDRPSHDE